ncbi:Leucine aminopeptidase 1 [Haplosporangium sp. Z 27]|nr:Leucine aminopeptidase 1 [Haplosporangium sp. Z 27]
MVRIHTIALLSLASTALAVPAWWEQWTLDKVKDVTHRVLPQSEDRRLVKIADDLAPVWTTEEERLDMTKNKIGFMDITDYQDTDTLIHAAVKKSLPNEARNQDKYEKYADQLSTANMEVALTQFSSFHTRFYRSETGHNSAKWLYKQIADLIEDSEASSDITIRKFEHSWSQFSIIARFEGSDESLSNSPVVIGAHQDSINIWLPVIGRSPGADDDGSGTVTILEVFRALVNTGFRPLRPVEFHWYSAEEVGLLGSQAVAKEYAEKGVEVLAMIQNDMTGYAGTKFAESYGVIIDHVDPDLTELLKVYAREYGDIAVRETRCGYACSDHASWGKYGYRSAIATEGDFSDISPYIHTQNDDVSHINFNHMKEFAKLTLGFAVELGYYDDKNEEYF